MSLETVDLVVTIRNVRQQLQVRDFAMRKILAELAPVRSLMTDERFIVLARVQNQHITDLSRVLEFHEQISLVEATDIRVSAEVGGGLEVLTALGWLPALSVQVKRLAEC